MKSIEHKIRVLIADDHTTVLAGLASIIGMQPDMVVVAEAGCNDAGFVRVLA